MLRRKIIISLLVLTLCLLSACASHTVAYFPVRQDPGFSSLMPLYGKIELNDSLLRLHEIGTDNSYAFIWLKGYSLPHFRKQG